MKHLLGVAVVVLGLSGLLIAEVAHADDAAPATPPAASGTDQAKAAPAPSIDKAMQARVRSAEKAITEGRYEEAIKELDELIKAMPRNAQLRERKGLALFMLGRAEDAENAYRNALKLNPSSNRAKNGLAFAVFGLGRYAEAAVLFRELADSAKQPGEKVFRMLGMSLLYAGDAAGALEPLERATAIAPEKAAAWEVRGNALFALHRYPEALESFERAIKANPRRELAQMSKGSCLVKLGRTEESLAFFDAALRLSPLNPRILFNKAEALRLLGRDEDARKLFHKVAAIDPEFPGLKDAIAALSAPS